MSERSIVVSQGDPEGVGLEILLRLAAQGAFHGGDRIVGDPGAFAQMAGTLAQDWAQPGLAALEPLWDRDAPAPPNQVAALARAVDLVLETPGTALVTAPIDKARCQALGFAHPGHTEYLAARAGVDEFAMLMAGDRIRVALATIHIPLREVPQALSAAKIVSVGRLLSESLVRDFGIARPKVGVLGLNPHAGEQGVLGREEIELIEPAIETLRGVVPEGVEIVGPLPADTAFFAHQSGELDGVVAMYHDQGLGPFKLVHFTDGINMTLGLPFVRTSPDHGTARDLVGTGKADVASMAAAIRIARGGTR